jgi:hypothetical protein
LNGFSKREERKVKNGLAKKANRLKNLKKKNLALKAAT